MSCSLKNYFSSPYKNDTLEKKIPTNNLLENVDSGKVIALNMQSVIKSVKKNKKFKKKKHPIDEEGIDKISQTLSSNLFIISPKTDENFIKGQVEKESKNKLKKDKKDLKTKTPPTTETVKQIINSTTPEQPILNDTQSKSDENIEKISQNDNKIENSGSVKNAFQVMMSARNKSIGSNSPGRNLEETNETLPLKKTNSLMARRKLNLETWANQKGRTKRKLDEEAKDEYIKNEMGKRKKRLKKLLENKNSDSDDYPSENEKLIKIIVKQTKHQFTAKKLKSKHINESVAEENKASTPKLKKSIELKGKKGRSENNEGTSGKIINSNPKETTKKLKNNNNEDIILTNESILKEKQSKKSSIKFVKKNISEKSNKQTEILISPVTTAVEPLDIEFLNNLSTPTKKRDSLLGYFNKIITPIKTTILQEQNNISNDKNTINTNNNLNQTINDNDNDDSLIILNSLDNSVEMTDISMNTISRPKRTCSTKRYIYESPEKIAAKKSVKRAKRILSNSSSNNDSPKHDKKKRKYFKNLEEIIDVDDATWTPNKHSIKLAPVFIKQIVKPQIDPEILLARKEFLNSGIPEKLKIEIERQKIYEESIQMDFFPQISHINQNTDNNFKISKIDLSELNIKINSNIHDDDIDVINTLHLGHLTECINNEVKSVPKVSNFNQLSAVYELKNVKTLIHTLKKTYENFPTNRCYKQLITKNRKANLRNVSEDESQEINNLNKSIEIIENNNKSFGNCNQLFTDIYQPSESNEFLVNFTPIAALKNFLSNWQNEKKKNLNDSSSSDFELTEGSNSNSCLTPCSNSVVLLGPSGCGKTNAVYALANEMNFKVLEINSGSKRTGKKILQELQEATQSHNMRSKSENNIRKQLFKSNSVNNDNDSGDNVSNCSNDNKKNKLALILIEDADIIFDQDDGFIGAINYLAATSKRPIILTANNFNCSHLIKLIAQNSIIFQKPHENKISMWLSVMSLVENVYMDQQEITKLFIYNKHNLRKTILELQFFIKTGGDRTITNDKKKSHTTPLNNTKKNSKVNKVTSPDMNDEFYKHQRLYSFYSVNQNNKCIIQKPINFNIIWCNVPILLNLNKTKFLPDKKKMKSKKNVKKVDDFDKNILDFYDNLTCALILQNKPIFDRTENHLNEEISEYLVEDSIKKCMLNFNSNIETEYDTLKNFQSNDSDNLSNYLFLPSTSKMANSMDYDPYLRSFCRIEKDRNKTDRKTCKFSHYLRNILSVETFSSEFFDNYAPVFDIDN